MTDMTDELEAIRARKNLVTLKEKLTRETWNDRDGEIVLTVDDALSALRQWLADEGLVVVPACCTAAMSDATAQYRAEMQRRGRPVHPDDLWALMLAAAPDPLEPDKHT
jgi:hypothetical protein